MPESDAQNVDQLMYDTHYGCTVQIMFITFLYECNCNGWLFCRLNSEHWGRYHHGTGQAGLPLAYEKDMTEYLNPFFLKLSPRADSNLSGEINVFRQLAIAISSADCHSVCQLVLINSFSFLISVCLHVCLCVCFYIFAHLFVVFILLFVNIVVQLSYFRFDHFIM